MRQRTPRRNSSNRKAAYRYKGNHNSKRQPHSSHDQRVIIIAPVGQDGPAMADLLRTEGFETHICRSAEEGATQIPIGAGLLLITHEAIELSRPEILFQVLQSQPTWSELPIIILTSSGQERLAQLLDGAGIAAGTVTLLERPITTRTLVHSVTVALRSRRRQYQVRDLVAELEMLNQTLEQRVTERTAEAIERAKQLRLLSAELSRAEERERQRIAHVLHDDLQQLLMAARMYIATLPKKGEPGQEVTAREIANLLERSFNITRSLSVELAPPILREGGLAAALEWLSIRTSKHYGVQITVEIDHAANPQAAEVRDFLYRAIRELLLNAVKHTAGKPVHIVMQSLPQNRVMLVVADKGPGMDAVAINGTGTGKRGFGLFNIRERVLSLGGDLQIESKAGRGTRISVIAPRELDGP